MPGEAQNVRPLESARRQACPDGQPPPFKSHPGVLVVGATLNVMLTGPVPMVIVPVSVAKVKAMSVSTDARMANPCGLEDSKAARTVDSDPSSATLARTQPSCKRTS